LEKIKFGYYLVYTVMVNVAKTVLLLIVTLSIGMLVMPQTASLFAGQHWWYNISGNGNQIPCQKCHADVYEELKNSYHKNMGCICHRANLSITYAEVQGGKITNYTPGKQAHAATTVACMLCHQLNASLNSSMPGPFAGTFNVTEFGVHSNHRYSNLTFTGLCSAHNPFVANAIKNNTLRDSTEACVACHMKVNITIRFHTVKWINVTTQHVTIGYSSLTGLNESYVNVTSSSFGYANITEVKP